jgi:hypothetical protein
MLVAVKDSEVELASRLVGDKMRQVRLGGKLGGTVKVRASDSPSVNEAHE